MAIMDVTQGTKNGDLFDFLLSCHPDKVAHKVQLSLRSYLLPPTTPLLSTASTALPLSLLLKLLPITLFLHQATLP